MRMDGGGRRGLAIVPVQKPGNVSDSSASPQSAMLTSRLAKPTFKGLWQTLGRV